MASLHPSLAVAAASHADSEAGGRRAHLRQVDLPLLVVAKVFHLTAAMRAADRQRRVELGVGRSVWHLAMPVAAMGLA